MAASHVKNIAIVGASGNVGSHITKALLAKGQFNITAVSRTESTAKFEEGVKTVHVDYEKPETIVEAFKGQDVLIVTLNVTAPRDTQAKLIKAAAEAGVPWIMPNEFGNRVSTGAIADIFGSDMTHDRQLIEKLGVSSWIGFTTGFWYEHSVSSPGFFGFKTKQREVVFFDEGTERLHTSTWPQVGRGVAALLSLPVTSSDKSPSINDYKNTEIFISSFTVNQRDMFESLKRVTGTSDSDWTISSVSSKERFDEGKKRMMTGDREGFGQALYTRFFFPGEFEKSGPLANELLGLPKEDLDEGSKAALALGETGYWTKYGVVS